MPLYEYIKEDGSIIEKIFSIDDVPNEITLEDGSVAVKRISKCSVKYNVNNIKEQDEEKKREERKHYMNQYNVEKFIPLKGQTEEQAFEDFKKTKYLQQEEILKKNEIRKKSNFEKWSSQRKSFKEMEKQYLAKKEKEKQDEYEKNKIVL